MGSISELIGVVFVICNVMRIVFAFTGLLVNFVMMLRYHVSLK